MKLKFWKHLGLQAGLVGLQIANVALVGVPGGVLAQQGIALGLGLAQTWLAKKAHQTNPDGTPAELPYLPSQKVK